MDTLDRGASAAKPGYLDAAIAASDAAMTSLLLQRGAPGTHVDAAGDTFLHKAARLEGAADVINVLLKAGLPVDPVNKAGDTPLLDAVKVGKDNVEVVTRLVAAGANINALSARGKTVFQEAKSPKVKKVLKDAGADKKAP